MAITFLWISIKVHLADVLVVPMTISANATQPQLKVSRHELTPEERRRGAEKAAEAKREKREESRRLAAERLSGLVSRAIDELERLIDDEDPRVRLRAAQQILERALGKANLPIEIATLDHERALAEGRETLARRLEEIREPRVAGPALRAMASRCEMSSMWHARRACSTNRPAEINRGRCARPCG